MSPSVQRDSSVEDSDSSPVASRATGGTSVDDLLRGVASAPKRSPGAAETMERFGPYRLIERLGQGGMGVVYRAEHMETGAVAAIKTVRVPRRGLLESIRREIHALARIRHPGVVRILGEGVQEGVPWYAMELVAGDSLRGVTRRAPSAGAPTLVEQRDWTESWWTASIPHDSSAETGSGSAALDAGTPAASAAHWRRAVTLIRRVCEPLAFLHGEGIVHRDLKPENILVREGDDPVLVDFGLVSRSGADISRDALQSVGQVVGTVAYMAPEQIRGELVDARADLYALGCILYELIAGRPPFLGAGAEEVVRMHLEAEPLPFALLLPGVPAELDAIVARLLAKRPEQRIGYADDLAVALDRLGATAGAGATIRPRAYVYRPGFVGRESAIQRFTERLEQLESGTSGFLLVGGESGVGKTRLLLEATRLAAQRRIVTLAGECLDTSGSALEGLRRPLQAVGDWCRERGRDETDRVLGRRGQLLARYEPALSGLPGQEAYPEPPEPSAGAARLRLFAYLCDTFSALATERPVLLLIDDLQWADDLVLGFLEFARRIARLGRARWLLAGAYRTEEVGPSLRELLDRADVEQFVVDRLGERELGTMVRQMLALDTPPRLFVRFLLKQSEGNPFFVAEYLRTAVAEGLLYRDPYGRWQVAEQGEELASEHLYERLPLPTSIRQLVGRRLDGLKSHARELANVAAVLGRDAPAQLVWKVVGLEPRQLLEASAEVLRRQVLEEAPGDRLRFVHDKIREVVYATLAPAERAATHRSAAETIESLFPEDQDPYLAALAQHWERGGELGRASPYYLRAARQARQRLALQESQSLYESYLRATQGPSSDLVRARIELGEHVLQARGELRQAIEQQTIALDQARTLGERALEGEALGYLGSLYRVTGDVVEARAALEEALSIHREVGNRRGAGLALTTLATLHRVQGRAEVALPMYEEAVIHQHEAGNPAGEGEALGHLGNLHCERGQFHIAAPILERALAIQRELGDRRLEGWVLGNLGVLAQEQNRSEKARSYFEQALGLATEVGDRRAEGWALGNLANSHYELGQIDESRDLLERAILIAREVGNRRLEGHLLGNLAGLHRDCEQFEQAELDYAEALRILRDIGNQRGEGIVLGELGLLHQKRADAGRSRQLYDQALGLLRQVGDRVGERIVLERLTSLDS